MNPMPKGGGFRAAGFVTAGERAKRLWERYSGAMSRRRKDRKCEHWPGIMHITKEIRLAEAAAFGRGYRAGQKQHTTKEGK